MSISDVCPPEFSGHLGLIQLRQGLHFFLNQIVVENSFCELVMVLCVQDAKMNSKYLLYSMEPSGEFHPG